ncbi:hypothetical protein [Archangium lansingense]|uniref:DUF2029 domain-containing protein n=1 Tax=Archangium lansingense TaxID=2995310 RepID=A0ABT4AFG0_9BACT|nr:hypothetical protein [Archangium lansinium]MCY1080414.1 hypothetical protein [Archangium lansinium]
MTSGSPSLETAPPAPGQERALLAPLLSVAAVALGYAIQFGNGARHPDSMVLLTVALVASLLAVVMPEPRHARIIQLAERATILLLGVGLIGQFIFLATSAPAVYLHPGRNGFTSFMTGIAVAAVLAGAGLSGRPWLGRLRLPVLVGVHIALGSWIIHYSPNPHIDVYTFHTEAFRALAKGINPYAIDMPNIYGHEEFYGPGLVVNGRLQVGFPYPPFSLMVAWVAHLLGGDYRYANLLAMGLAALLMASCRPGGQWAQVAAVVFLFTPRTFFVLEQGWTDAYVAMLVAATVWSACRAPRLLPVALGLLFAVKHYMVLAAPLVMLLYPGPLPWRETLRTLLKAAAVATVVTLPFAVLDPVALYNDLMGFQLRQPFRMDALSYLSWWAEKTGRRLPSGLGFAVVLPALGLSLWRAPRTPSGFAAAMAMTFTVFFAFSKQAFANYYYFIIAALCSAVAAWTPPPSQEQRATP